MNPAAGKTSSRGIVLLVIVALFSSAANPAWAFEGESLPVSNLASFTQINLYPNIETIGVVVSGSGLPKTAQLLYRQSTETNWHTGHPLMRIDDGRLVGSLFGLSPAVLYEIKVVDGTSEIGASITTQTDELQFTPSSVLYVNDDALPGGNGSAAAPFQKIQHAVNVAVPGTQVLVADGIYREEVTFPTSGSPGNWIQVRAAGSGTILEGSDDLPAGAWTHYEERKNIWVADIGWPIKYLARNGLRFYMYDSLGDLLAARGHDKVPMNEGWYSEPISGRLYVRLSDDPSNYSWQVPRFNRAFSADGRDWLWIEGFEIRFFGTGNSGGGVFLKNASHVVLRRNKIHNVQLGVYTEWTGGEDRANDLRLEYNEIYDPKASEWPWNAVKGSSMEGTAIVIRGHIGAIVRGNQIHQFFNGIYTGSSAALENSGIAFDVDIYNNHIHHIMDDALEPEGACVNNRFRNNIIDSMLVGVSLAPITQGPVWVLRSTFANYSGRSVKWDINSDGVVLIYHNTSWTSANAIAAMSLISPAHNAVIRNNIFQSTGFAFEEVPTGSTGHDWNNNNWHTTRGSSGPHFKWENVLYNTIAELCTATGLECKGYEDPPGLTNPAGGDFTLLLSSPNIDRGALIPGINDVFAGRGPDVGAFESMLDSPPTVSSSLRADVNPTSAAAVNFTVTFSEPVTGVDVSDFGLTADPGITGASIAGVTPVSGTAYTVNVNTGSGNGTIRLDIMDNDSILDSAGNPLGGAGAGNGSFNSGEFYTVDKNLFAATGILRTDLNPTMADTVHFVVTFSQDVTGVDAGDFTLALTGNVGGAIVTAVSGFGSAYSIAVDTGTGDGTLRLDLVDNDSILDGNGNPLGGVGAGNGNFTAGETYTINRSMPVVISSVRADPDPTTADNVRFLVTFSEVVTGVDAADFTVSTTGVSEAKVLEVSGSGNIYVVNVSTGSGTGSLRLDLLDNDSILDSAGAPLGGPGLGNGGFMTGEIYTVNKPVLIKVTEIFMSDRANDGWVLESNENSNRGGTRNASELTFNLGDDSRDRQFRAILHFSTSSLPDNAVITMVILSIKKQGQVGTDPFTTHGNILIDIRSGAFGSLGPFGIYALQVTDFQNPASRDSVGMASNNPVSGWYWSMLDSSAFPHVNLTGGTQFRLRFQLDDNDDMGNDIVKFSSGNYNVLSDRPQLLVEYYIMK